MSDLVLFFFSPRFDFIPARLSFSILFNSFNSSLSSCRSPLSEHFLKRHYVTKGPFYALVLALRHNLLK